MTDNEKNRLEVVIEQNAAALVDANKRIEILRIMIDDFSRQNAELRKEISRLNAGRLTTGQT